MDRALSRGATMDGMGEFFVRLWIGCAVAAVTVVLAGGRPVAVAFGLPVLAFVLLVAIEAVRSPIGWLFDGPVQLFGFACAVAVVPALVGAGLGAGVRSVVRTMRG